ncbi:MAG: GNAT family N-acetyltransferase [Ignavibacteria bacterium]|jgi:phosphinothricin acetyltransferase
MKDVILIRPYQQKDFEPLLSVFTTFAKDSFAAYCDEDFDVSHIREAVEDAKIILVLTESENLIGFGFLSKYKPYPNFNRTGVLTYFILPEYTGKGLGTRILNELISFGRKNGITNYLANISSKNEQSLNFHKKHGFVEVGQFKDVGIKFNQTFDIVWVQIIFGDK